MKKAQGLPLSTIAIAAIVLIVIVVVIAIFGGQMGWFSGAARSCVSLGGTCKADCKGFIASEIPNTDCKEKHPAEPKCCKVIVETK